MSALRGPRPAGGQPGFAAVAGNSISVAAWTGVSRVTGFARAAVVAAVLGPTFFGNLFQATNLLPNVTYEFLTGSLFASLLVPALVRHVDAGDRRATERLAGGFLGVATLAFAVLALAAVVAGPLVLRVLTLGVADPAVSAAQQRAGWPLLALLMPQVLLYGVAGAGVAVQNAHGRFALAAAAPALENLGVIATLGSSALVFGTGTSVHDVGAAQLVLLGGGTTAAVALHAAAQWWGARRVGVTLVPRAGWRDDEIRRVVRLVRPSLGYAGLSAARLLGILIVAGAVPGGVVAFGVAMQFFHLPVAIGARPVAAALLPRLARLAQAGQGQGFRDEWARGVGLSLFFTVPAALAYVVLAGPLARSVSFGEMAGPGGAGLVAVSLAALAAGVVGDANFVIGTQASYARLDARSPLRAMALGAGLAALGMAGALLFADGPALLFVLGLAVTVADLSSWLYLDRHLRARLPAGTVSLWPAAARALLAAAVMVVPAAALIRLLPGVPGVLAAVITGLVVFVAVQRAARSPELDALLAGFRQREGRRA